MIFGLNFFLLILILFFENRIFQNCKGGNLFIAIKKILIHGITNSGSYSVIFHTRTRSVIYGTVPEGGRICHCIHRLGASVVIHLHAVIYHGHITFVIEQYHSAHCLHRLFSFMDLQHV